VGGKSRGRKGGEEKKGGTLTIFAPHCGLSWGRGGGGRSRKRVKATDNPACLEKGK